MLTTNVRRIIGDRAQPVSIVLGYEWNYSNPSPLLRRLEAAESLTAVGGVGAAVGHSDFDEILPYKNIRRCNLRANGEVVAYQGEQGFTFTPAVGIDVVVEIPAFYYRVENDVPNQRYRYYITDRKINGFALHPAFNRPTGAVSRIYVAAYETGAGHRSTSGIVPLLNQTRAQFREGARSKGVGWAVNDMAARLAVTDLMRMEFANNDVQVAIGTGSTASSGPLASGRTNSVIGSGREAGTNPATVSVVWRGIENFWGNVWEWLDGLNINNGALWVCTDPAHFADDTTTNYTQLSYSIPTNLASSFATRQGFDSNMPWANLPSAFTGGSNTTFLCDACWSSTAWRCASVGGSTFNGRNAGVFAYYSSHTSSHTAVNIGARLLYIPQ